jgi:indolepyruvate ferredoxin oxidoreductase beta subunit
MSTQPQRPLCILIAALGGEGGGVLTDWLVSAAMAQDLPVQSTSIPGVAQRTGATTYYIEIFPLPRAGLNGKNPLLALYPGPGNIDLMIASELLEVGRALENGYVTPDRTVLIGSTHRIYSMTEKTAMSDRRYDDQSIHKAAEQLARRAILADLAQLAEQHNTVINAVLLGVIAGSGILPLTTETFATAIRASGIAVASNLRGFEAGLACARGATGIEAVSPALPGRAADSTSLSSLLKRVADEFPAETQAILKEGVKRVYDYQDAVYAQSYLERLLPILTIDHGSNRNSYALTCETGRYLALWMSYEDVIRVADLKTRPQRFQRVRAEIRAKPDEPVYIDEFLKPGIDELAAILPAAVGARLLRWAQRNERRRHWNFSMRIKSHTVSGFLRLWLLARLRPWRRRSLRFQQEQELIGRWLDSVRRAALLDYQLALEIVECANLNKGYGETFERGRGNFLQLMNRVIEPVLAETGASAKAAWLRQLREAALADPDGKLLAKTLEAY